MLLMLTNLALAEPDHVGWSASLGTGLSSLSVSSAGVAAFVDEGSDSLVVLDTETWQAAYAQVCTGARTTAIDAVSAEDEVGVFVGCDDGALVPVSFRPGYDLDVGEAISVGSGGGDTAGGGGAPVLGLAFDDDDARLWIVVDGADGDYPEVHVYDPDTTEVDADWTASSTSVSGVEAVGLLSGVLLVVHGGDDTTKVDLSTGSTARSNETLSGRDFVEVWTDGASIGLLADQSGSLVKYLTTSSDEYAILLDDEDGLTSVTAVTVDESEGFCAVGDSEAGLVKLFSYANGAVGDEALQALDVPGAVGLGVVGDYLVAVGNEGTLSVLTDRPWVEVEADQVAALEVGELVTLQIASDSAGDFEVVLDGDTLAEGTLDDDRSASVQIEVADDWAEGPNRVYVEVQDGSAVGSDAVDLVIDNPPSQVSLDDGDVGFGHEKILLDFSGISDEDLARYTVYLTTVPWEREDYATGGPAYEGTDDASVGPVDVEADPGEDVYLVIEGLTNGTTYYVGVRATDEGGQEGPMSRVIEAQPQETVGAAGLSGETGGFCGAAGTASGWLAGLAALGVVARRRSVVLFAAVGLVAPLSAQAEDDGPKQGNAEIRVGSLSLADTDGNFEAVYGDPGYLSFYFEGGKRVLRVLETDLTVGLTRKRGSLVGVDSGASSSESGRLSLFPVGASLTLHGELFDNQPIVPFVRAGTEYWFFMEQYDYGSGYLEGTMAGDVVAGGRGTWSYGYGVSVLLDWLDPTSASQVQARWGIRDTYLVAELREYTMLDEPASDEGFSFTGSTFQLGLKMDL